MKVEELKKELGARIKSCRLAKNLSQEEFCEIINLDQPNLSNIETGKNFPDILTLFSIIEKVKIEPNFLFNFLDEDKTKYTTIDFEILDILLKLPKDSKLKIKNVLELIK